MGLRLDRNRIQNVPIRRKMTLTIRETAKYGSIGIHKKVR